MPVRVLVVDDSIYDRQLVCEVLTRAGHEIAGVAASGPEAVERYRELSPDVVTIDLVLPYLSGPETAERIREIDPSACIIAVTGLAQPSAQAEAMAAGIHGIVAKPIDTDDLLGEVIDALTRGPAAAG